MACAWSWTARRWTCLGGSTIDYVSEMIRSSFAVVGNPQSESACGCGSSLAVRNFEVQSSPGLDDDGGGGLIGGWLVRFR
ncbi:hypothetical protein ACHAW5_003258 [Stephanodiscus triporus]|uniref:Uncharacterized protein n=1 Tax=Stephanodiscus triporus TaxID=2934178 RepID=A0ABD3NJK5_9STRA